jgi:hypothetical protein
MDQGKQRQDALVFVQDSGNGILDAINLKRNRGQKETFLCLDKSKNVDKPLRVRKLKSGMEFFFSRGAAYISTTPDRILYLFKA